METLITRLAAEGIKCEDVTTIKNGVTFEGIRIDRGTICPVIYRVPGESDDEYCTRIISFASVDMPSFEISNLYSKEYLLANTFICIQKTSDEAIVKRDYLNTELYLRCKMQEHKEDNSIASTKLTTSILELADVSEEELWESAKSNMMNDFSIRSLAEIVGIDFDIFEPPFFVGTTKMGLHGASLLYFPEVLQQFCNEREFEALLIIPSSTEEVILMADDGHMDANELAALCNEVNHSEVEASLQLEPVIYRYSVETNEVSIAARYN